MRSESCEIMREVRGMENANEEDKEDDDDDDDDDVAKGRVYFLFALWNQNSDFRSVNESWMNDSCWFVHSLALFSTYTPRY
ncbi:uncharacterized protein DS421_13g429680 [Arachis hypogaea]|nr:uncharacterized protein DS421_13g429680 [Arachis hypogaea]